MRYIFGPELFWLIIYGISNFIAKSNIPPSKAMDDFIQKCWFYVPVLVVLCFILWWLPFVEKRWLLPRVWVASILGGHFVLEKIMSAYSEQGPGIGTAYMLGMGLLFFILMIGTVFILIKF